jgi:predicted pyridoxine 5'-phosphate oxidase superfamily flavin-nucleotide-binding protein
MRRATLTITIVAFFITTQVQAAESYISLSRAVVLATVSPDLLGTTKIDPRPFAKCFRAQGLTVNDLKAAKARSAGPRVNERVVRCLDKLIGL